MDTHTSGRSSIRTRLLFAYVATLLAAVLLVGLYLTTRLERTVMADHRNNADAALAQLNRNYTQLFGDYAKRVTGVLNDYAFTSFLRADLSAYDAIVALRDRILPAIRLAGINQQSMVFRVYSDNDFVRFAEVFNYDLSSLQNEAWYDPAAGAGPNWTSTRAIRGRADGRYVGLYYSLPADGTRGRVVVALFFDETELYRLIETWRDFDRSVFLIDGNGRVLSSSERGRVFEDAAACVLDDGRPINAAEGDEVVSLDGREYYLSRAAVDGAPDWSIVSLTSTSALSESIRTLWRNSAILCLICLAVAALVVTRIANDIIGRIRAFLSNMQAVWKANFERGVEVTGTDEISAIELGFNRLANNTHRLIHDVYLANLAASRLRAEKTDAELIALRRQINPHYLFNTLETIRMNMVLDGDRRNAYILGLFAQSFRDCISSGLDTHPLGEELKRIETYFEIQQYCFRGDVRMDVEVDPSLHPLMMPVMTLQPLVENAIYHGIELKGAPGRVRISARTEGGDLVLVVEDDGVGMAPQVLATVRAQMEEDRPPREGSRIALRNVNMRMKLMYGPAYRLYVDSQPGAGTRVTMRLPLDGGPAATGIAQ